MWAISAVEFIQESKRLISYLISVFWKSFSEPCGVFFLGNISSCVMFCELWKNFIHSFKSHCWKKLQKVFPRQDGMLIRRQGYSKFWKVNLHFEVLCDPKTCGCMRISSDFVLCYYSFPLLNYLSFFLFRILVEVNQIQKLFTNSQNLPWTMYSEIPSFQTFLWR